MSGLERHVHHNPCGNCGHGRCHHKRERVYPEDGPAGSYHYEYTDCPEGNGRYR